MNDAVPADPLVPVEVDLRGLAFMPLDVVRLLDSDLFALTNGEEFKAALSLWCKAWLQVPAASLPNDDRVLAYLSGAGGRWGRVKGMALRGWQLCSDDRLYHPVIAEKALAAWEERVAYRERRDNEAERLRRHREEHKRLRDQLREFGITYPHSAPMETLRSALQDAELNRQRSISGNAPERVSTPLPDTGQLRLREGEGQREGEGEGYLLELPLPPEGGTADGEQDKPKPERKRKDSAREFDPLSVCPSNVSPEVWAKWVQHRKEIRKPLTPTSCSQQAAQLATCPNPDTVIAKSIASGWQGLFPDKEVRGQAAKPSSFTNLPKHNADQNSEEPDHDGPNF